MAQKTGMERQSVCTEEFLGLAENINACFQLYGLDRALFYYAGAVADLLPLFRLVCFAYEKRTGVIHTLARLDFDDNSTASIGVAEWELPPEYPRPSRDMEYPEPVVSRFIQPEELAPFASFDDHLSRACHVARLPLAFTDRYSLFLGLYVEGERAPTDAVLRKCLSMGKPLADVLVPELETREKIHVDAKLELPSSMAGLEMCPALNEVRDKIYRVAGGNTTVLVTGETGSGKEMVADAIRALSPRRDEPYVRVNCGSLPEGIIDSLLFGHEKGAFTGAHMSHKGYFEQAHGGTIFLDEVGELPLSSQTRLLRVLDSREIQHVGGSRSIPLDIRVIAATHRDLRAMVGEGGFREDLWYRLCVYPIRVPPLRERKIDIAPLASHFLAARGKALRLSFVPELSRENLEALHAHLWPGNVRELALVIERALLDSKISDGKGGERVNRLAFDFPESPPGWVPPSAPGAWASLEHVTDAYIASAIEHCSGHIFGDSGAAALLGVHPNTLRNWKKKKEG